MAFKRSVEDSQGVTHADAYHKVDNVRIRWHQKDCRFSISIFHDQATKEAGKDPMPENLNFRINSDGYDAVLGIDALDAADMNVIKAIYEYAKTELDDESIVDC